MRVDQHFYYAEQEKQQEENRRQLQAAEQRSATAEQQLREQRVSERRTTERFVTMQETTAKQQAEAAKIREVPIAKGDVLEEPGRLEIQQEHVLQSSAWHSIEIDKRTGRPVENPTFMYGREYYRERAHETGPVSRRNAAAGEVALVAASRGGGGSDGGATGGGSNSAGTQGSSAPMPAIIPNATTQGPPARQRAKDAASNVRDQLTAPSAAGPIWPYLVALVVILFCLVALLH